MQTPQKSELLDSPHFSWCPDLLSLNKHKLCESCIKRSTNCPLCLNENFIISLEKRQENEALKRSIKVVTCTDGLPNQLFKIVVKYPLTLDPEVAYRPQLSNYETAKQASVRLKKKLKAKMLIGQF